MNPVYLDHAATTPVDGRVVAAMLPWLSGDFGNPSSTHALGRKAAQALERAARQVSAAIGGAAGEIVWTSGATESDNLALLGVARAARRAGNPRRRLLTLATEHRAVLDPLRALADEGFELELLPVRPDGRVDPSVFAEALRSDTLLASVMLVNNEIGVIQPVADLARLARAAGVLLHVDAAQAPGKLAIDAAALGADLITLTAHKAYGPKGVGALWLRRSPPVRIEALQHGGGQQRGLRSGTLAVHQIVGMGEAFAIAADEFDRDMTRIAPLRERLWEGLAALGGVHRNGDGAVCVPQILNVSFEGTGGEALLAALPELALSTGSACASGHAEPSHVLRALGRSDELADASLRFSLGRGTSMADIDLAITCVRRALASLRVRGA